MDSHPVFMQAFGMPAGTEWIIILIIALLIFGPKLPSVMRGLGGSIKEFKKGIDEGPSKDNPRPPEPPGSEATSPTDPKKP